MKRRFGGLTIMVLPDEGATSRSVHLSPWIVRLGILGLLVGTIAVAVMATSWWFLAIQAGRSWRLQADVDSLRAEAIRVGELAETLARLETEYERIRLLFGNDRQLVPPDLWLPPSGLSASRNIAASSSVDEDVPTGWPLTEAGFVTRALIEGDAGDHPGLDIAVPSDSYVRSAGAGRVVRVGEDPLYGFFVVLEHREGYQTVYGHLSMILVERGQAVQRGEVIALSGSTGRSTAAHLHFEILLNGVPVDPLTMVKQPG